MSSKFQSFYTKPSHNTLADLRPNHLKPLKQCEILGLTPSQVLHFKRHVDPQDFSVSCDTTSTSLGLYEVKLYVITTDSPIIPGYSHDGLKRPQPHYLFPKHLAKYFRPVAVGEPQPLMVTSSLNHKSVQWSAFQSVHSPVKFTEFPMAMGNSVAGFSKMTMAGRSIHASLPCVSSLVGWVIRIMGAGGGNHPAIWNNPKAHLRAGNRKQTFETFAFQTNTKGIADNENILGCFVVALNHAPLFISSDELRQCAACSCSYTGVGIGTLLIVCLKSSMGRLAQIVYVYCKKEAYWSGQRSPNNG